MAWTWPTALFFAAIGLGLVAMTLAELRWPSAERRGFLPLVTSRGDRFFISLLASAYIHLAWLAATTAPLFIASALCLALGAVILRWG